MDIRPVSNMTQPSALAVDKNSQATEVPITAKPVTQAIEPNAVITQVDAVDNIAKVTDAIKNINKAMEGRGASLEFSIDEDSNRTIVKVMDQSTKTLIRQIPTGEVLEIAKALDQVQGLLLRQKA